MIGFSNVQNAWAPFIYEKPIYIYTQLFSNAQYSDSWTIHEELSSKCIIQLNRTDIFMPMTSTLRRIPTLPRMLKSSRQGLAESINLGPPWGASFCVKYSYIIFNARSKHCLFSCLPSTSSRGPFPVSKSDIYISHVPLGGASWSECEGSRRAGAWGTSPSTLCDSLERPPHFSCIMWQFWKLARVLAPVRDILSGCSSSSGSSHHSDRATLLCL